MLSFRPRFLPLLAALPLAAPAFAQGEADFHRAYYLEHEERDLEAARALYLKVADGREAPAELRAEARRAADALAEDLAASDLARLVPSDVILYAELSRPGEELETLLRSLGLLGRVEEGRGFAVSPLLVRGLLGLRGAAVAVTRIDPERGPSGVLLLHPGDLDVVRGLIETAVPAGGEPLEPIGGFPAWSFEGRAVVALTGRLLVAGTDRGLVEDALARLAGGGGPSLADNEALRETVERGRDSLLSFCVNAEPLRPMLEGLLAQEAARDPEAAAMVAFLDPKSLRSLSGRLDVDPDGVDLELALELAEGHRSLAFHLLRMPQVDRETLARVPSGAAFFAAFGLNPKASVAPLPRDAAGRPIVTAFDLGREVFGNLRDVVVYGLPPSDAAQAGVPDVALELRSNDPERTHALVSLGLQLAGAASGGGTEPARAAGGAERWSVGGLPLHLARRADGVVLTPSPRALERALGSGAASVLDDPAFARDVQRVERGHVVVAMANVGRCLELAGAARRDARSAELARLLADTVVRFGIEHTDTRFALRARAASLPDVSGLVGQALRRGGSHARGEVAVIRDVRAAPATAPGAGRAGATQAADPDALAAEVLRLAAAGDAAAARAAADALLAVAGDEPVLLNDLAWTLSTEDPYAGRAAETALALAEQAAEASGHASWYVLDTLALVRFQLGHVDEAVRLQRRAVELARNDPRSDEARAALERYESAVASGG